MDLAQAKNALERGAWFSARSESFASALLGLGSVKLLEAGCNLFRRGDSNCGLYAVLKGSIRISGLDSEGNELILTFIEAPEWFGELALFDENERTHDAEAVVDTYLFHIPLRGLQAYLLDNPIYWRDFGLMLSQKLRLSFSVIEDMALLPAPKRLAKRILMMVTSQPSLNDRTAHDIHLSQSDLGNMLSISRQTTNIILKELESLGVLSVSYGKIQVLDIPSLNAFVYSS